MSNNRIYELIDPGEWKLVFWTCFIEVSEVNTHSPVSIYFFHENYVSQSFWIINFSNELGLKKLLHLNSHISFFIDDFSFLNNRLKV